MKNKKKDKGSKKIRDEDLIHIKLEYEEGVESKKDILYSEMELLKIAKVIKRYHVLRLEELNNKINLCNKIKDTKKDITKLNSILPLLKIPSILKKEEMHEKEKPEEITKQVKEKHYDLSIESQLQEIRDKLQALQ